MSKPKFDVFSIRERTPQPVADLLPLALEAIRIASSDLEDNVGRNKFPAPKWMKNLINRLISDPKPLSKEESNYYYTMINEYHVGVAEHGDDNYKLHNAIRRYFDINSR